MKHALAVVFITLEQTTSSLCVSVSSSVKSETGLNTLHANILILMVKGPSENQAKRFALRS